MNKFMHDNLSTPSERNNMLKNGIHPRVVNGRTVHKKVNTCKVSKKTKSTAK